MRTQSTTCSESGLTLLEVMIVLGTVGLLAVFIAIPCGLSESHNRARRINCVSNLKQVGLGFRMWAYDHSQKYPWQVSLSNTGTLEVVNGPVVAPHFLIASNEFGTSKILACGMDARRVRADRWSEFGETNLSYFIGLDADETKPQSILSGDRNITGGANITNRIFQFMSNSVVGFTKELHKQHVNIGLGDGSVMQANALALRNQVNAALLSSGQPALRLAIP